MTRKSLCRIMTVLIVLGMVVPLAQASPVPVTQESFSSKGTWETWDELLPETKAKVDPRILAELRGEVIPAHLGGGAEQAEATPRDGRKPLDKTRFLVHLKVQADLDAVQEQHFDTRDEQRTAVFDALVTTAQATQGPIKNLLNARMSADHVASYQSFYIFNGFAVEGDLDTIIELAQQDDVERLVANYPLVPLWKDGEAPPSPATSLGGLDPDNWNIDLVDAERVWSELGITGEGAVVGGIDTGVDWTHPALQPKYRGYDLSGSGTDHNYNWFDPNSTLYPGGDLGPSLTLAPYDTGDHGTHTMGTMVGDGGTPGTRVGMAPGAKWVAISLNDLSIVGSMADDIMGHKAFQWMLCPTDLSGALSTADCSKAPDVVNNSWGSSNPADEAFRPAIQALRAAGIAPVFASGNPSAGDGSIGSPGSAPEAITVGATDVNDNIASFSGRGPSFYEGEQKPELSAPGVNVNSTVPGGGYSGPTWSGTSMAAPHVAGLVALMTQADLQDGIRDFNVDELEQFMEYTSLDLGDPGPDDDYGYGRIDAYNAVRWVLSAGDLQGTITDQSSGMPIEGAHVSGSNTATGDTFATESGTTGAYSTTVPAGTYNITVDAWGYQSDTFSGQSVITGVLSIKNFALTPMATAQLTGQVLSGTTPISGALVTVAEHPATQFTTGADGTYTLTLPVDTHAMIVEASGYRILQEDVSVASSGSGQDFAMTPAPTILLVEADASYGWFVNRPVHNFFAWALDETNYLYDLWEIEYTAFNDTQTLPDGSLGYGVPSTTTLRSYDLVIWAHTADSPQGIGADDELMDYLDSGGRLLLSGQDIGYYDDGTTFYDDYLHADYVTDAAASEGETISGSGFLSGLNLDITSGALHNYDNTALGLSPDAAGPEDGAAYPVLTYDNGSGPAALAVDPCNATYRAVYFAVGYENIGPRAYNRDPAIAQVIDESIQWAWGTKPDYGVGVSTTPVHQMGATGSTVTYDVWVANTGAMTDTFTMSLSGNLWPTRIYSGVVELATPIEIAPCSAQNLSIEVDIPTTAATDDKDTVTITATGVSSDSANVTTTAFPLWQVEAPMSTPRYRLAAASLPGDIYYYAIGGQGNGGSTPMSANERYNACTGKWESMAPMPTAAGNVNAAVIGDKIYVPGGYNDGTYYDLLQIYDTSTNSWSSGTPLSTTVSGPAVAAYDGKLYTFGGSTPSGYTDKTYEYNPMTDTWTEKAPLPGGSRAYAAAAELDGKIYVAGGWSDLSIVEVYDPATDTWSTAASMNVGRQSPGLVAGPDGYLYVSGGGNGWNGLTSAERYDPVADAWTIIPSLNDGDRAGSASAFAAGRIFAIGGSDAGISTVNESLRLFDSFCLSDKSALQSTVQPGDRITYTVEIHSDAADLPGASIVDPIPAGTTFTGFGVNTIGATYNGTNDEVAWSGTVTGGSDPVTFTFGVDLNTAGWTFGDLVTNEAAFDSGAGMVFTRTAISTLDFPDPSPSVKTVDKDRAMEGDVLTYTVYIKNASSISDTFTLLDPIPADTTYVAGSLTYTLGTGSYNAVDDAINWTGVPASGYCNTSGDYEWGDSGGSGTIPGVSFSWVDITTVGTALTSVDWTANTSWEADDEGYATLSLPFTFNFYGTDYSTLYVDSNGQVGFSAFTSGTYGGGPIPHSDYPNNRIALFTDDLDLGMIGAGNGTVYYYDDASHDRFIVAFEDAAWYGGSVAGTWEVILYENGTIVIQYLTLNGPPDDPTGIENSDGSQGIDYGTTLSNNLAIAFLPDDGMWPPGQSHVQVTFAVTTATGLPANTWITNTATITGSLNVIERSAGTLINPVDLSTSVKTADKSQAVVNEVVTYDFSLQNTGILTATGAVLTDAIPANTTYVPGSVACGSGVCTYVPGDDAITWSGDIAAGSPVTLTFAVTLTTVLPDQTPVINTATLDDGVGNMYALQAQFLARSPDLSASFKQATPVEVEQGDTVTYTVYIYNSGDVETVGEMSDVLPTGVTYVPGSLLCGSGSCGEAPGVITWTGTVPPRSIVPVQFQVTVSTAAIPGSQIINTATITDTSWGVDYPVTETITVIGDNTHIYLPLVLRDS